MNINDLIAIDVHVMFTLETEIDDNAPDEAAKKYFGDSGVGRNRYELAEYYRSRKTAVRSSPQTNGSPAVRPFRTTKSPPLIFHTGHSDVGTGQRVGGGMRLKYGAPMDIDDVAVDFPNMPIIMAHP
jgi:hypothetical protein